jgi:hypothetical protein
MTIRSQTAKTLIVLGLVSQAWAQPVASTEVNIENAYYQLNENRYAWTIWVAEPESKLREIRCVRYKLDPTFPDPERTQCDRAKAFSLSTSSWGEFSVGVQILWQDGHESNQTYRLNFTSGDRQISKDTVLTYPLLSLNRLLPGYTASPAWPGFSRQLQLRFDIPAGAKRANQVEIWKLPDFRTPRKFQKTSLLAHINVDHLPITVPINWEASTYSVEILEINKRRELTVAIH